jgi:hypothetical protein
MSDYERESLAAEATLAAEKKIKKRSNPTPLNQSSPLPNFTLL